jgi:hypothetical protein
MKRMEMVSKSQYRTRRWAKRQQNQAERTDVKRRLKKDPESVETKPRRRFYGWGD